MLYYIVNHAFGFILFCSSVYTPVRDASQEELQLLTNTLTSMKGAPHEVQYTPWDEYYTACENSYVSFYVALDELSEVWIDSLAWDVLTESLRFNLEFWSLKEGGI